MNKFDQLVIDSKALPFEEGWKKVWEGVFSLEKVLVAIQKPVEKHDFKEPLLFLGTMEDQPCLFAFTDEEHYKNFQSHVLKIEDPRVLDYYELTIEKFLNLSQHLNHQKVPFVLMNFGNEHGFHTESKDIVPIYRIMRGDSLHEQRIVEGTEISLAIPDEIEEIKKALLSLKDKYKDTINHVSALLVKIKEVAEPTLVIEFKRDLTLSKKKEIMPNLHQDLAEISPLFQIPMQFTEEGIVPDEITSIVQVSFQD